MDPHSDDTRAMRQKFEHDTRTFMLMPIDSEKDAPLLAMLRSGWSVVAEHALPATTVAAAPEPVPTDVPMAESEAATDSEATSTGAAIIAVQAQLNGA